MSPLEPFSYPEPFLRAVRRGALAKSISNWHLIGYNEGYCSNTGYILLPCFYGIRFWIWPEPLVAPRVRRALGTRMPWNKLGKTCALILTVFHFVFLAVSSVVDQSSSSEATQTTAYLLPIVGGPGGQGTCSCSVTL